MSKRKRDFANEDEETTPNTSLQHHPLSFLIPKQLTVPFSIPHNPNILSDTLIFSQDDINDNPIEIVPTDLLNLDIWKMEDPDLKFVKFKKPYIELRSTEENMTANLNENLHLDNITQVTDSDYFKQNLKANKMELITELNDDDALLSGITNLINSDLIDETGTTTTTNSYDGSNIKPKDQQIKEETRPDFIYDTKITRSVLISHVLDDFVHTISKLLNDESLETTKHDNDGDDDDDYDDELDLWDTYSFIFSEETKLVRPDILNSIKSKLLDLISTNSHNQLDQIVFSKLLEICLNTLKESLPIEWHDLFESKDNFSILEYQKFAEIMMSCCSIVIILYSNDLIERINKHENSFSMVIDFICIFGSVLKSLYMREKFSEIPDFFIPTIKHYISMISTLYSDVKNLPLDDSSVTRLEYISFDILFVDILVSRERANMNIVLEDLRANFAKLIISIYSSYEDQRVFIFTEIVDNFGTLNPLKSKARNFRPNCGISIQLISFLIVSLIQCHNEYYKTFDYSQYSLLTMNHTTKAKKVELQEITDNLWSSINYQVNSMSKAADEFVISFIKKIISSYTPSLRKIIENTLADFLLMLEITEFPVCSIILNSMLTNLLYTCNNNENTQSSAHALFFEMIGLIGSKILTLKNLLNLPLLDIEIKIDDFELFANDLIVFLSYTKFKNTKSNENLLLFDFISLIHLSKLNKMQVELNKLILSHEESLMQQKLKTDKLLLNSITNTISKLIELPFQNKSPVDIKNLSDNQVSEIYKKLIASQDLTHRYNDVLSFILSSLNHPKTKSRMLAVKNLTLLINREPTLLQDEKLRNMIKRRLTESYASVTDAILDLLSKVLECKNEYIEEYTDIISQKIADPSVAVKKKTANLIKYMFLHTNSINSKVKLAVALLSQLDDEEDRIVDLSCRILADLLFVDLGNAVLSNYKSNPVSIQNKAYQIIYVLCGIFSMKESTWNLFERFFEEKIIYTSSFNKSIMNELKQSLEILVETMLELITDSLDKNIAETNVTSENIMGVMSTFVKCNENLISQDQLITIQPYIINDFQGSKVCFYALKVLNLALNHQKSLNRTFVQSCKESLMKRLTKFNSKELDFAIQCVWKLFLINDDTSSVSKACISTLKMLLKYIGDIQRSVKDFRPDSTVLRLLYLIGGFGRYCNFERDRELFVASRLGLLEKEPISVFFLKYLLKFCDSAIENSVRKVAIKNTLNICVSYPKLFFSIPVSKLIESTFKKKDLIISNIVIGSLLTFLEHEELKMIKKNGLDVKRSGSIKLDIAVFHGYTLDYVNDGLCSTLVQKYINNILHICLEKNPETAMNSINFLRMVIKFGFCNPKICFPTVIALECAKSNHIRHIAIELHKFLFEKFETLIESTYSEALKTTFAYVSKVYQLTELANCSNFLKLFFRIVIERKSKQRIEKFIQAILRSVGTASFYKIQKMSKEELTIVQTQIIFLCININEMEFTSQQELLMVITYIEKTILSEESIFLDQFNLLMDLFDDDDQDDNSITDKLKYISTSKVLLSLNCLTKCLITNYSISSDLILKYQESTDKKEFRAHVMKSESNRFFTGEIKKLLVSNEKNQLTLLYKKIQEFEKN